MKKILNYIMVIGVVALFTACEDVVNIDLEQGPPKLSVDGMVRWLPYDTLDMFASDPDTVKLSLTGAYFANSATTRVTNAKVWITEWYNGTQLFADTLKHLGGLYDGFYITQALEPKLNHEYELNILYNGESYISQKTKVNRVPWIDSISWEYQKKSAFVDAGWYPKYNGPEFGPRGDNYWFRAYRNGKPYINPEAFFFTTDETIDDNSGDTNYIANVNLSGDPLDPFDEFRIEGYSVNLNFIYYLEEVRSQIQNRGMFAEPPYNPRTNIINTNPNSDNYATGWFEAVGMAYIIGVVPPEPK